MKNVFTIAKLLPILLLLTSCATSAYYQVYRVIPVSHSSKKIVVNDEAIIYEDTNCIVVYNFWDKNGNTGFQFYNKTDKNIYLNMEESFFIINGMACNYYNNRVYTNSIGKMVSSTSSSSYNSSTTNAKTKAVSGVNYFGLLQTNIIADAQTVSDSYKISYMGGETRSSEYSVSSSEEKIICIPSKTFKIISSEYILNNIPFRSCNLIRFPTEAQIESTESFDTINTPLHFGNRITYSFFKDENSFTIENDFYVSKITNYTTSQMFEYKYTEFCGRKSETQIRFYKQAAANKFFIKYY